MKEVYKEIQESGYSSAELITLLFSFIAIISYLHIYAVHN